MKNQNYVSVRIKTLNTQQAIGQINHDTRFVKVNHIRNNNQNIFYDANYKPIITNETKIIKNRYNSNIQKQKEIYKNNFKQTSQLKNNAISGVITFSNAMIEDLKNNEEKFIENTKTNIKNICDSLGVDLIYFTIHTDEKTPHIHFMTNNFDSNNGKGKSKELFQNKEKLRQLQNDSGSIWQNFGAGYSRGISKSITKKNHYSVLDGHKKEIEEIISQQKEQIENLKKKRDEIKSTDISLNEKKEKYNKITQQQNKLRESIKTLKTTLKNLKSEVIKDTNEIIASIPLFGNGGDATKKLIQQKLLKKHKQEIINQNNQNEDISFYKNQTQNLTNKLSQINQKTTKLEELNNNHTKTIANLNNSIKTYKSNIKILEQKYNFNYINVLEQLSEDAQLQYNKQLKNNQIKEQQLEDLTKQLKNRITPNTPSL